MRVTDLNNDELIMIFKYCSTIDHRNLTKVCKKFEVLIETHFFEKLCRELLMVSHIKKFPEIFDRTLHKQMKFADRLRIHDNWTFGANEQVMFFQHRENYVTHLQMDDENLYTASLGEFNIYNRRSSDGILVDPIFSAGLKNDSMITSFKRNEEMIAGSRRNGSVFIYSENEGYNMEFLRDIPIVDLDLFQDILITTTKADSKFHRMGSELDMLTFDSTDFTLDVGLESVNFNPLGDVILGTKEAKFYLIDSSTGLVSNECTIERPQIYNSLWINESSFLYTSWNSPLSLRDVRCDLKQQKFSCGNFTATSIDYDGRFGVIYGTLLGMLILCDLRNPDIFERVFHLHAPAICRAIKTDESNLFVSSDNAIHLLNFN